jgi:thymidylate kinase
MKLLIVEGLDRVGKNTLLANLSSNFENFCVRHFTSPPKGLSEREAERFQQKAFHREFQLYNKVSEWDSHSELSMSSLWTWNRSHLGEAVYGKIYRNYDATPWIIDLERFFSFDIKPEIYLLLLTASPDFIVKRDDGKSFTTDHDKKNKEIQSFVDVYNASLVQHKLHIRVDDGENYLSAERIHKNVLEFLEI